MILPSTNGGIAHLFVVYGYQGSEVDLHKPALTKKLLEAVFGDAGGCGTGQPVVDSGDFNAGPLVTSVMAKALACGLFVDLEAAYSKGCRESPSPTFRFDLDWAPGTRRETLSWSAPAHWLLVRF